MGADGAGTPQFSAEHFRGYLVDLALKNVAEEFNLKIERFKVSSPLCCLYAVHSRLAELVVYDADVSMATGVWRADHGDAEAPIQGAAGRECTEHTLV